MQVSDAMSYLAYLAFVDPYPVMLEASLRRYGRLLLRSQPRVFTSLLRRLCTGDYQSLLASGVGPLATSPGSIALYFQIPYSIFFTEGSSSVLAGLISSEESPVPKSKGASSSAASDSSNSPSTLVFPKSPLQVVDYIYLYTDHQEHLLSLLTEVAEHQKGEGRQLSGRLVSTLLELYLSKFQRDTETVQLLKSNATNSETSLRDLEKALQSTEASILALLNGPFSGQVYDPAHAMLLVNAAGFAAGQRYLLEKHLTYKSQSVDLLLRIYIERNDTSEIFKLLKYGSDLNVI